MSESKNDSLPKVKPLEGIVDYLHWQRNALHTLLVSIFFLLLFKEGSESNSAANRVSWNRENSVGKNNIILMLSESVQVRAIAYCDDSTKSAYELWQFLESTYTASNEEDIRVKIDSLVYLEGTDWDDHLNKLSSLIAQLAIQDIVTHPLTT